MAKVCCARSRGSRAASTGLFPRAAYESESSRVSITTRPHTLHRFAAMSVAAWMALLVSAVRGDTVERRGGEPRLEGRVTNIDDNGVTLLTESGASYIVLWDRVFSVEFAQAQ